LFSRVQYRKFRYTGVRYLLKNRYGILVYLKKTSGTRSTSIRFFLPPQIFIKGNTNRLLYAWWISPHPRFLPPYLTCIGWVKITCRARKFSPPAIFTSSVNLHREWKFDRCASWFITPSIFFHPVKITCYPRRHSHQVKNIWWHRNDHQAVTRTVSSARFSFL